MSIEGKREWNIGKSEETGIKGQDQAQEEANMLSAKLGVSPETGKVPGIDINRSNATFFKTEGKEPSAEDYDNALAALDELKKIVDEEPVAIKIYHKLQDLPVKAASGIDLAFRAMGVGIETFHPIAAMLDPDNKPDEGIADAMKRRWERTKTVHENENAEGMFNDAENKLKALKTRAEQFENKE